MTERKVETHRVMAEKAALVDHGCKLLRMLLRTLLLLLL